MTIETHKVTRVLTEEEVKLHAKADIQPFKTFRQDSKAINFGCLFGISHKRFSANSIEPKWSMERIETFIKAKNLKDSVENMAIKYPTIEARLWKYYAVSNYIIEQFFESYKGFHERIDRNTDFAKEYGYIRSFHGGIRHLPLLTFVTNQETGQIRKDENFKEVANWINIAANTSIQTDETAKVMGTLSKWCSDNNIYYKYGHPFGTVHDSVDFYVKRDHVVEVCNHIQEEFEKTEDWQKGIKLPIDLLVVDIKDGDYYKHGSSLEDYIKKHDLHNIPELIA